MDKVLVVDDNELHRRAANAQLGESTDHTVVAAFDEAQKLLTPNHRRDFGERLHL